MASDNSEAWLALIDRRIAALDRERRENCEVLQKVICLVAELSEQLKQHFAAMDVKLARLQTLLADRPPLDPPSRAERPH